MDQYDSLRITGSLSLSFPFTQNILSGTKLRIDEHCPGIANDLVLSLRSNDHAFSWRLTRLIEKLSRKVPRLEDNYADSGLSLDKLGDIALKSLDHLTVRE